MASTCSILMLVYKPGGFAVQAIYHGIRSSDMKAFTIVPATSNSSQEAHD